MRNPLPADDWLRRFTDIEDLDDTVEEKTGGIHDGKPGPPDMQRSTDPVRVVVDSTGVVRQVVVAPNWRRSISPHALGEALLASANDGIVGALDFAVEPQVAHPRLDAEDAGGDPTGPVARRLVAEALDLLGRFDTDLTNYQEQLCGATAPHRTVGMNGRITVTMSGGLVDSVEVDTQWAGRCRYTEIGAEAMSAFRAAQQTQADARAAVREPGSLARLRELSSDPWALCRQLGLATGTRP